MYQLSPLTNQRSHLENISEMKAVGLLALSRPAHRPRPRPRPPSPSRLISSCLLSLPSPYLPPPSPSLSPLTLQAQRLLFSKSTAGDLRSYLSAYFDTSVGGKKDSSSYRYETRDARLCSLCLVFFCAMFVCAFFTTNCCCCCCCLPAFGVACCLLIQPST